MPAVPTCLQGTSTAAPFRSSRSRHRRGECLTQLETSRTRPAARLAAQPGVSTLLRTQLRCSATKPESAGPSDTSEVAAIDWCAPLGGSNLHWAVVTRLRHRLRRCCMEFQTARKGTSIEATPFGAFVSLSLPEASAGADFTGRQPALRSSSRHLGASSSVRHLLTDHQALPLIRKPDSDRLVVPRRIRLAHSPASIPSTPRAFNTTTVPQGTTLA